MQSRVPAGYRGCRARIPAPTRTPPRGSRSQRRHMTAAQRDKGFLLPSYDYGSGREVVKESIDTFHLAKSYSLFLGLLLFPILIIGGRLFLRVS